MVMLGRANSRFKDFYDIWMLSRRYAFSGDRLARAIAATFARRKTEIPQEVPDALTEAFASDPTKRQQWNAFRRDLTEQSLELIQIVGDLAAFLMPHAVRARDLGPRGSKA